MSSAILYLAIVAIWAVVLVPRWLRQPQQHAAPAESDLAESADLVGASVTASSPALSATAEQDGRPGQAHAGAPVSAKAAVSGGAAAPPPAVSGAAVGSGGSTGTGNDAAERATARPAQESATAATARRTRVLQARRRTLATLVIATAGGVGIAVAHLAASWVSIPPAVLLVFFLLLLRTAARIDAQRAYEAHERARRAAAAAGAGQPTAGAADASAAPAAPTGSVESAVAQTTAPAFAQATGGADPGAEIIDISARIEDQPYDQYLDAESRAVGD